MHQTIEQQLRNMYKKQFDNQKNLILHYFAANGKFFKPEERGVIQDKIFNYLKEKNIEYVHVAWGYAIFISSQSLIESIQNLINQDNFVIISKRLGDNLMNDIKTLDEELHSIFQNKM